MNRFFKKSKEMNDEKNMEKKKGKKKNKNNEPMTVQDLFHFDEITDKGIVRVDKSYMAVMECGQTNLHLLDFDENAIVWNNFRVMLNSINIRYTMVLQSHFFDVSDFVKAYKEKADSLSNLTPQYIEAKEDVINNYMKFTEERNREQVGYLIFRYNPDVEGTEAGFETGNSAIDDLLKKFKTATANTNEEESRSLAISILEEVTDLAFQLLNKLNIKSIRLNRLGVLNMIYSTLNRDLTVSQRIQDVSDAHSFTEFKVSETPAMIADQLEKDSQLFEEYLNEFLYNNSAELNEAK